MPIFRHHYFAHVEKDKEFQTRNINIFIIFRYSQVIHKLMEYTNDHSPDPPIIPHFSINFHNSSYSKLSLDKFNWRHSIFRPSPQPLTPCSHSFSCGNTLSAFLNTHNFLSTSHPLFTKTINHVILIL